MSQRKILDLDASPYQFLAVADLRNHWIQYNIPKHQTQTNDHQEIHAASGDAHEREIDTSQTKSGLCPSTQAGSPLGRAHLRCRLER